MSEERMNEEADNDWELLNGLADGELEASAAEQLERRLAIEPALSAAYTHILGAKSAVHSLRTQLVTSAPTPETLRPSRWRDGRSPLAIAAAVLLAIGVSTGLYWDRRTTPAAESALAWHQRFVDEYGTAQSSAEQSQSGSRSQSQAALSPGAGLASGTEPVLAAVLAASWAPELARDIGLNEAPDLSGAHLRLVGIRRFASGTNENDSVALHYRGASGCSLTLLARPLAAGTTPARSTAAKADAEALLASWPTAQARLTLISYRMNPNRFAAILAYSVALTSGLDAKAEPQRILMAAASEPIAPCA